jgi:hypothetical protein
VIAAIRFLNEIAQRGTLAQVKGDITDNRQAHVIDHEFLHEGAGHARFEPEEVGMESLYGNGNHADAALERVANQLDSVAIVRQLRTFGCTEQNSDAMDLADVHGASPVTKAGVATTLFKAAALLIEGRLNDFPVTGSADLPISSLWLGLQGLGIRQVPGRSFLESGKQELAGRGRRNFVLHHDVLGGDIAAIEMIVGAAVRAQRGAFERDAGKKSASARVGEDFGVHGDIGGGFRIAPFGSGRSRGVAAELDLATQQGAGAMRIHYEENEVRGFPADLKADAGAFQRVHGRRSPRSLESGPAAAGHGAAANVGAHAEGQLLDGRKHNHAFSAVQHRLGQIVRDVQDLHQDFAGVLETVLLVFLGLRGDNQQYGGKKEEQSFHENTLLEEDLHY